MSQLWVEVAAQGGWVPTGPPLVVGSFAGSLSNNTPEGRDILRFSCEGGHSVIERSEGGFDVELEQLRVLGASGFEVLAILHNGESYEFDLRTDRMVEMVRTRFRHEGEAA